MKSIFAIIFAIVSLFVIGCTSDSDPILMNSQSQVSSQMVRGEWRITYFFDSDKDETQHFLGYTFIFGSDQIILARKGSLVLRGSWSVTDGKSNDDHLDHLHFNILFTSPRDFEELSEDWEFISQSSQKIELIHVSGGNGGTDYLTFEKI